jgi:hypothetical protein
MTLVFSWFRLATIASQLVWLNGLVERERRFARRDKPTVKQVYALCAALCERHGEEFPESRTERRR